MEDKELNEAIASRPLKKVTKADIEAKIIKTSYLVIPETTVTLCNITLENGFSVRGESPCIDPINFNMQIGQEIAQREAFAKLWQLERYLLAEDKLNQNKKAYQTSSGVWL